MKKIVAAMVLLGLGFASHAQAILLANDYNFWNAPIGTEHYCVALGVGTPSRSSLYECKDAGVHVEYYRIQEKGWAIVRTVEVKYSNGVGYDIYLRKIR